MGDGFGRVSEGAQQAGLKVQEKTTLISEKASTKAVKAKDVASKGVSIVGSAAGTVAAGTKKKISKSAENLQGIKDAAMSPKKMAKAGGMFFVGVILVSMAFTFLPMIAVSPMNFSILITCGSLCIMGSVV